MATLKINDYYKGGRVVFVKHTVVNNKKKVIICTMAEASENEVVTYPSREEMSEEERRLNEQLDFEEEVERFLQEGNNDQDFTSRIPETVWV